MEHPLMPCASLRAYCLGFIVSLAATLCCRGALADDQPIATMVATLAKLNDVTMEATTRTSLTSTMQSPVASSDSKVGPETRAILFKRDHNGRLLVSSKFQSGSKSSPVRTQTELLLTDGDLLSVQADLDDNSAQLKGNPVMVSIESARLAGAGSRKDVMAILAGLNEDAIIVGILGYVPLETYCDGSAKVSITDESGLIAVESISTYGHLQLWLDRKYGCLPRKLKLRKQGSDICNGQRVDQISMNGNGSIWPTGGVEKVTWSAEDITLARSGEMPYIQNVTLENQVYSKSGPVVTLTTVAAVTSVAFMPRWHADDFRPTVDIPKGSQVAVKGAPQLPYIWDGHNAVPRTVGVVTSLDAENANGSTSHWLLIVGNAILVVVVLAMIVRKRFKQGVA